MRSAPCAPLASGARGEGVPDLPLRPSYALADSEVAALALVDHHGAIAHAWRNDDKIDPFHDEPRLAPMSSVPLSRGTCRRVPICRCTAAKSNGVMPHPPAARIGAAASFGHVSTAFGDWIDL